ncbi:hypothetical protein Hanom_Chr13g01192321 [Helianthus anomalus]
MGSIDQGCWKACFRLRNEDDVAAWSTSRFLGSSSWTLGFYALDVVLMFWPRLIVFLEGLGCLKLDCIDLFLRCTWVGCSFKSRIG